jgi:hypothetical protein
VLTACDGSGSSGDGGSASLTSPPAALSKAQAWSFLTQATPGPTEAEAQELISIGYDRWINEQIAGPATHHLPSVMPGGARQRAKFEALLATTAPSPYAHALVAAHCRSLETAGLVNATISGTPPLAMALPGSSLGQLAAGILRRNRSPHSSRPSRRSVQPNW